MDVRLIHIDHEMPIALGAVEHALDLLDKGLPPLWVGPAEPLLGFRPRQRAAMESHADRLATAHQADALAHPADQAGQGPAGRGVGSFYGWGGRRALGGADHLAELGFAARAKKGRPPPVRRNVSASGPWAL